jgi:hypothetical protein
MSTPKPNSHLPEEPTADDLAGTPVSREEGHPPIRLRGSGRVEGRGRAEQGGGAPVAPSPPGSPTADDLAGIPVAAEGEEDLTVRPRKPGPQP